MVLFIVFSVYGIVRDDYGRPPVTYGFHDLPHHQVLTATPLGDLLRMRSVFVSVEFVECPVTRIPLDGACRTRFKALYLANTAQFKAPAVLCSAYIYKRKPIIKAVSREHGADVIGFVINERMNDHNGRITAIVQRRTPLQFPCQAAIGRTHDLTAFTHGPTV